MGAGAFFPGDFDVVDDTDLPRVAPVRVTGVDDFDLDASWVGGDMGEVFTVEFVNELVRRASAAVDALQMLNPAVLSPESLDALAVGTERVRRQVDAAGIGIAGFVDTARPFRKDGMFSAKAYLKHRLQLSGAEAYRRVQTARMHTLLPLWASGASVGQVGVAQSELIGQLAANPRLDPETLHRGAWELFIDALDLPFKEFEANVRKWEKLADVESAAEQAERNRKNRDADIERRTNGSWDLSGTFDDVAGVEFAEIFGHFVEAEWDADWAEARERVGDTATMFDLRRTQSQRRADALLAMARAAATCPPWSQRPLPTVNYLIDEATYESTLTGDRIDPLRYREMVCRTQSGSRTEPGRRRQAVVGGSRPPGRVRRHERGDRPRSQTAIVHRGVTGGGDVARDQLCVGRMRRQGRMVPSRPLHRLESARLHRPPQRRPTVQPAQPVQGTGLPGQPRR